MAFLDVPGAKLHFELHGSSGPPLALITANGVAASLWGDLVPMLAGHCRVLVYDAPGADQSEAHERSYTMETLADHHDMLAREAFGEPIVSFGHASGAWVAVVHAMRHPQAVAGLALASMAGIFAPPMGALEQSREIAAPKLELDEYIERFGALFTGLNFNRSDKGRAFIERHWEAGRARSGSSAHGPALRDVDRMAYWAKWTQPTLALFGTHDRMAVPAHGFDLDRQLVDVDVQFLYPAGHFMPMEQPARVTERVVEFAKRVMTS